MTERDVEIGRRLRSRRIAAKLSQEQISKAIGVSFQQIQKYEKGLNRIPAARLERLADALGCSVLDFFMPLRMHEEIAPDALRAAILVSSMRDEQLRAAILSLLENMAATINGGDARRSP